MKNLKENIIKSYNLAIKIAALRVSTFDRKIDIAVTSTFVHVHYGRYYVAFFRDDLVNAGSINAMTMFQDDSAGSAYTNLSVIEVIEMLQNELNRLKTIQCDNLKSQP